MASFSYRYGYCNCSRAICSIECNTYAKYGPKPKTNADRIRAMTDEELTKWFRSVCAPNHSCSGCKFDQLACTFDEWLKQEAE